MKLLLVRHGPAGDRAAWAKKGRDDAERPLTAAGREKTRKAMRGLAQIAPKITVAATSPLLRALQTAELLGKNFPGAKRVVAPELSPQAAPSYTLDLLARLGPKVRAAAVVGHEPHLSLLMALAVGAAAPFGELKKAGAALVQFDGPPRAGKGRLVWLASPATLRALG